MKPVSLCGLESVSPRKREGKLGRSWGGIASLVVAPLPLRLVLAQATHEFMLLCDSQTQTSHFSHPVSSLNPVTMVTYIGTAQQPALAQHVVGFLILLPKPW